jgi:hypothetical protein
MVVSLLLALLGVASSAGHGGLRGNGIHGTHTKLIEGSDLGSSLHSSTRSDPGPKHVFAHYMLCFQAFSRAYPNPTLSAEDVPGYVQEIAYAQKYGVDGFVLEYGMSARSQHTYNASLFWMFKACEEHNAARGATAETAAAGERERARTP